MLPASKHWLRLLKWTATWKIEVIGKLLSDSPVTASLVSESVSLVLLVVFLVRINHDNGSDVLTWATQIKLHGVLLMFHSQ